MRCRLSVFRPGTEVLIREFADLAECMKRQAEIEQRLLAEASRRASAVGSPQLSWDMARIRSAPDSELMSESSAVMPTTSRNQPDLIRWGGFPSASSLL